MQRFGKAPDPGIVYQDVNPAKSGIHTGCQSFHGMQIGDVAFRNLRLPARL